jgi:HK97 family phage major capsid protein
MSEEVKQAVEGFHTAFAEFKKTNDERIKQIEKKGAADAVTEDKLKKIEDAIQKSQDDLKAAQKRADELEVAFKRHGGDSKTQEAAEKEAKEFSLLRKREISVEQTQAYKGAFHSYITRNNAGATADEVKALSVGSDPDGGYAVHPDMSGRINTLVYETSPIRQVANVVTISSDALEGMNDLDEAGAGWIGETDARNETTSPKIGEYRIPVHEVYAEPRATQKMLDDAAFNAETWLAAKVADKLSRLENAAFVAGDGVKKPRGFLNYSAGTPSASAFNVIEQIVSGASGAFASSNPGDALINLVYSLKAAYRENAVFMMRRATLSAVRRLKDGQNNYLWQPDFQQRQGGTLVGFNVVEAEDMPAIAANSLSIAFGNFNVGYQIVDRIGLRILRDSFTAKPYVKFYTTKRVGGDVVNFEAIKLMKFST